MRSMTFPEGDTFCSEVVTKFARGIKGWRLQSEGCINR